MTYLMPMSCVHIGALEHDHQALDRALFVARRYGAEIVLLGDVMDNQVYSGTKVPGVVYETKMNPDQQVDAVVERFRRFRVRAVVGGNHCERTKKASGIHPEKVIADRLGVRFYPEVYTTAIGGFNFVFTHGVGSGDTDFRKILLAYDSVDCMCVGHNHELSYRPVRRVSLRGGSRTRRLIHQVRCGSFLDYAGYAKRALHQPGPAGCPLIDVSAGRIRVLIEGQ